MIAQIADRGHPRAQMLPCRCGDDVAQLRRRPRGDVVEGCGAAVGTQVDVGVDQPGQQRGPGHLDDLATVGRGCGSGLHSDDPALVDQDEGTTRQRAVAVEGMTCSIAPHQLPPSGGWSIDAG